MISKRYFSYINTAEEIIRLYNGNSPFAEFLKSYFRSNRKAGSKDRKIIASLCYGFFRMGKSMQKNPESTKMIAGFFLCNSEDNGVIENLKPEWKDKISGSVNTKIPLIRDEDRSFEIEQIFPAAENLSAGLDIKSFLLSLLRQPSVFIRIRPGHRDSILRKLKRSDIFFTEINESSIGFPQNVSIEKIADLHTELVIQDLSSQKTAAFLPPPESFTGKVKIWDCCAGGGGKSIMAIDHFPAVELTVSDNRTQALNQLKQRFYESGIHDFRIAATDLSKPQDKSVFPISYFDLIIADVPCTGSGTWSRTPERLYFFDESEISHYADLQYRIAGNVIPHLRKGGYLLYITCSVYALENEGVVEKILANHPLKLLKKDLITGASHSADTLFAAVFISE